MSVAYDVEQWSDLFASQARRSWVLGRTGIAVLGTVPCVVAGVSLLAEAGGGLYWAVGGLVAGVLGGVINAWVLLVEIRR